MDNLKIFASLPYRMLDNLVEKKECKYEKDKKNYYFLWGIIILIIVLYFFFGGSSSKIKQIGGMQVLDELEISNSEIMNAFIKD